MRSNIVIWWILTIFFAFLAVLYTMWNIIAHPDLPPLRQVEWAGTLTLTCSAVMGAFVSFYLGRAHRAQGGEAPADILTADIDDADPEIGEFSPWSWWPLVLAASAAILVIGLAVNLFLFPIGLLVFIVAIVGWVYEYYRGNFAR